MAGNCQYYWAYDRFYIFKSFLKQRCENNIETVILNVFPNDLREDEINKAALSLKKGEIVIIPTETVYGLAANALDEKAVEKIFIAKGRPSDNPLIVHIESILQIYPLVEEVPDLAVELFKKFSPGPLTIVLNKSKAVPNIVSGGLSTVAIRIPSHPVARAIIAAAGVPIAAPSANRSGRPSPTKFRHLKDMIGRVPIIVDGGDCEVGIESTVVSLCGTKPRLLRPGAISIEQLREVLGDIEIDKSIKQEFSQSEKASSPGMKYRHYSPSCEMYLAKGDFAVDKILEAANKTISLGKKPIIICFDEYKDKFSQYQIISLGAKTDYKEQAARLFDSIRCADEQGADVIYSLCPNPVGIGLAVYNRMLKAAGHKFL